MILLESGVLRTELARWKQESKPLWQVWEAPALLFATPSSPTQGMPRAAPPGQRSTQPRLGIRRYLSRSTTKLKCHELVRKLSIGLSLPDEANSSKTQSWLLPFKAAQTSQCSQHPFTTSANSHFSKSQVMAGGIFHPSIEAVLLHGQKDLKT